MCWGVGGWGGVNQVRLLIANIDDLRWTMFFWMDDVLGGGGVGGVNHVRLLIANIDDLRWTMFFWMDDVLGGGGVGGVRGGLITFVC